MVYLQPSKKQYISHKKNTPVYYHFIFLILSIILNLNIVNAGHGDEIFWVGAGDIGDDTLDADTQEQTNPLKTIQHAISLASSTQQETVTLLVGTHSGGTDCTSISPHDRKCSYNIDTLGKPIIIQGSGSDPAATIIDCEVTDWTTLGIPRRGFIFHRDEKHTTIVKMLTIKRCRALKGIRQDACQITSNTIFPNPLNRSLLFPNIPAHVGGGIVITNSSSPHLDTIIVEDCMAGVGGGIYTGGGMNNNNNNNNINVILNKITLKNNYAKSGGGVSFENTNSGIDWKEGLLDGNRIDNTFGLYENCKSANNGYQGKDTQIEPGRIMQRFGEKLGASGFGHAQRGNKEFVFLFIISCIVYVSGTNVF